MNLLETYINAALDVFLAENVSKQNQSGEFNLNVLKQLMNFSEITAYIQQTLANATIGEGQGRSVYKLPGGKVLKLAKNPGGVSQNYAEATVCKSQATIDIFPAVFDVQPQSYWLVVEEAMPITRVKFKELTGMSWSEFLFALGGAFPKSLKNPTNTQLAQYQHALNKHYSNVFLRRVIELIKTCKYEVADIGKFDSWGIARGKPVIIDSGLTQTVLNSHYRE